MQQMKLEEEMLIVTCNGPPDLPAFRLDRTIFSCWLHMVLLTMINSTADGGILAD